MGPYLIVWALRSKLLLGADVEDLSNLRPNQHRNHSQKTPGRVIARPSAGAAVGLGKGLVDKYVQAYTDE